VRAAVVGAGVYGATIAVELARVGHQVGLFERHRDLLCGATRSNQARLHSGYHYPRSLDTALAARADAARFATRFSGAINRRNTHHYAIAWDGSLTSPEDYLWFCERLGGDFQVITRPSALRDVKMCVRVPEAFVNVHALREQLRREVNRSGVRFHRDRPVDPETLDHDLVVVATYGLGWPEPLRYEVCEVALVDLAGWHAFSSWVVMDGPFCSLDPLPDRAGHLLYHVDTSVHHASVGMAPEIPAHLASLLDRGPVVTQHSHLPRMLAEASRFLHHTDQATSLGSLFTVRAVLPDVDATDARPLLIRRDGRLVHVLAGKIDGAPRAAEQVAVMAGEMVAA
jgi:hypothetical protein